MDLCPKHNLAIAPDGKCVLCRRTLSMALQRDEESWVSQLFTWLLLLCLLATLAGLLYVANNPAGHRGGRYVEAPPVGQIDAQRSAATRPEEPEPQPAQAVQPDGAAAAAQATPAAPDATTAQLAAAQQATIEAEVGETPSALRRPPTAPGIPAADLTRARSKVEVIMYSAPWCYICDRARDFLKARDVALVEYDIEMSGEAMDALSDVNPASTIPTFQIADEAIVGFHPWVLEDAINAVALERYASR
jgi:glutaredoxin